MIHGPSGRGQVDTTTVYGALAALSFNSPRESDSWSWNSLLELTGLLIGTDRLRISPVPTTERAPSDHLGSFLEKIQFAVGSPLHRAQAPVQKRAAHLTRAWVRRTSARLLQSVHDLDNEDPSFGRWVSWHVDFVWPEHCARLGGFSDSFFEQEVALSLAVDVSDIRDLDRRAENPQELSRMRRLRAGSDYKLAVDVYVVGALIRGAYYNYLARESSCSFLNHRLRNNYLPAISRRKDHSAIPLTNTHHYLNCLLAMSAFRARTLEQRTAYWSRAVERARKAYSSGQLALPETPTENAAIRNAVDAVRRVLRIAMHPTWIEKALSVAADVGSGALAAFLVEPWLGPFVALGSSLVPKQKLIQRTVSQVDSAARLDLLARTPPGRISRSWLRGPIVNIEPDWK